MANLNSRIELLASSYYDIFNSIDHLKWCRAELMKELLTLLMSSIRNGYKIYLY
jgi:hypothetical protein